MQQVILNYYVNKLGTYLFIAQRVLYCILWSEREKCGYITTYCTKETCIFGENHGNVKTKKLPSIKKIALELFQQRLGHRSTRSLLSRDTANVWKDRELRIDPDPFCTSCKISSINKKARSKNPIKPKAPFKWVFIAIYLSTEPKKLTSDTTFSNYLLIVDAYSKIPKRYGMEKITTEEVMDKLDMFQSKSGKIEVFGSWDLERISADAGKQFTLKEFKE